jgi:uncharacterized protein (TIGR03435 family)
MRVYSLVVGRNGSKMALHDDGHIAGTRLTTDVLATVLSRELATDVVNRTALPGKYDFQLAWTPDSGPCAGDAPTAPSFFTGIQQQLGLKLEAAKGPVEILIVNRIERPPEN